MMFSEKKQMIGQVYRKGMSARCRNEKSAMNRGAAVCSDGKMSLRAPPSRHALHHDVEPEPVRQDVLELRGDGPVRPVTGHENVERVPDAERVEHAERELAEQPLAPHEEEDRDDVQGEHEKVAEVEKRKPFGRRVRDDAIEHERRLGAEQRDAETVKLAIEGLRSSRTEASRERRSTRAEPCRRS